MSTEITRDPATLVYHLQCLRCGCTGTLNKSLAVETFCSCLCCHYKDASCVYTGIDQCIDCQGKYSLHAGNTVWAPPYFACQNHCLRTKKSLLSNNFTNVTSQKSHVNNVRNTLARGTHKTLLHSAVLACDPDLTWDLLCRGANPFVKDRMGVTPVDLARLMLSAVPAQRRSMGSDDGTNDMSNEAKVHSLLPKQAFPEASVEFPPPPSDQQASTSHPSARVRTRSDMGPSSLLASSPRSPPRRKCGQQLAAATSSTSASVLTSDSDGLAKSSSPPLSLGLHIKVPPPELGIPGAQSARGGTEPTRPNTCSNIGTDPNSLFPRRHRRRSQTMTHHAPRHSSLMYPPSQPRSLAARHQHPPSPPRSPPRSPNHPSRKHRHRSMSLSISKPTIDTDLGPHPSDNSYGFARRQRGMSLTESPTAATGSKAILTGIVNAGIRHAKVNAPQLSKGTQVFSPLTLLKMNSGNEFVMEETSGSEGAVKPEQSAQHDTVRTDKVPRDTDRESDSSSGAVLNSEQHQRDLQREMLQLKADIIGEVEIQGRSVSAHAPSGPSSSGMSNGDEHSRTEKEVSQPQQKLDQQQQGADMVVDASAYAMFAMSLGGNSPPPLPTMSTTDLEKQHKREVDKQPEDDDGDDDDDEEMRDSYDGDAPLAVLVSCTGCLDELALTDMAYSCPREDICGAHLCPDCLFRLVFVTITSALYAVPAIRCPGRCMCAVPTRLWRGGLKGMPVAEDDREDLKVTEVSMVALLDLLYEAFEVMCLDYEGDVQDDAARSRHTCTVLKRVEDVAIADGFTLEDVYAAVSAYTSSDGSTPPSPDDDSGDSADEFGSDDSDWESDTDDGATKNQRAAVDNEGSEQDEGSKSKVSGSDDDKEGPDLQAAHQFSTFADFASFVLPGKVVAPDMVGASFMAMEDILNNSEVESARLNVKQIRKQHLHTFLAEVAAVVRDRLDLTKLQAKIFAEDTKEDAEGLLMRRYMSNAQALLKIRCSGCDETTTLLHATENGKKIITSVKERESVLTKLIAGIDSQEHAMTFLRTYTNFMNGKAPSGLFISTVFESFISTKKCDFDEDARNEEIRRAAKSGVLKLEAAKYFTKVLSLIVDMERRFAAQVELLRKYPKIKLVCCDTKHCFLCKVGGHHKGQTCTEVQQAEMGTECQYCPGCGVATLRTEGCKEVLCVCGAVWKWEVEGDDDEESEEGDWEDSDSDSEGDY